MSDAAIHETKPSGRATGPRTPGGKRRTRYNALKRGLFFNGVLAQGESRAEFDSLLKGLIVDFQPEGVAERLEVERLALLYWRQRRFLQSETAEIAQVAEFRPLESLCAQLREKIEVEREGELLEKMVELSLNPLLIRAAMEVCKFGQSRLEKLDVESDREFIRAYRIYAEIASEKGENVATGEEVRKLALQMMDEELRYLTVWREVAWKRYQRLKELGAVAAEVPSQNVSERLVRYETHLSREIDRTLNRLERLQNMRSDRAVPKGESC